VSASSYVHLDVEEILAETDKALLLRLEGGEEVWCPLSQIADVEDYRKGDKDVGVSVTGWWASKNGLA